MAEKKFLVDINLTGNQLIDFRVENIASLPTGLTAADEGRIVFLTTTNKLYTWDGTQWVTASDTLLWGDVVTVESGEATIQTNAVATAMIQNDAITTIKVLDKNITNAKLADMAGSRIKGTKAGDTVPQDLTSSEVRTILNIADGAEVNVDTNIGQVDGGDGLTVDLTSSTGTGTTLLSATITEAGLLSASDKVKLNTLDQAPAITVASAASPTTINVTLSSDATGTNLALADDTNAGLMSPAGFSKLATIDDNANYIDPTTIVFRAKADMGVGTEDLQTLIDWVENDTNLTDNSDKTVSTTKAVKAYVDGKLSGLGTFQGSYDVDSNTPVLEGNPSSIVGGDYWIVTVATSGNDFYGTELFVGDQLIANSADPIAIGDWTVVHQESKIASTSIRGEVFLANDADAIAGTDTGKAMTPENVNRALTDVTSEVVRKYGQLIGDGSLFSYTVNHGLNEAYVEVKVYDASTKDEVGTSVTMSGNNAVLVTFNSAPGVDAYYVLVQG